METEARRRSWPWRERPPVALPPDVLEAVEARHGERGRRELEAVLRERACHQYPGAAEEAARLLACRRADSSPGGLYRRLFEAARTRHCEAAQIALDPLRADAVPEFCPHKARLVAWKEPRRWRPEIDPLPELRPPTPVEDLAAFAVARDRLERFADLLDADIPAPPLIELVPLERGPPRPATTALERITRIR